MTRANGIPASFVPGGIVSMQDQLPSLRFSGSSSLRSPTRSIAHPFRILLLHRKLDLFSHSKAENRVSSAISLDDQSASLRDVATGVLLMMDSL